MLHSPSADTLPVESPSESLRFSKAFANEQLDPLLLSTPPITILDVSLSSVQKDSGFSSLPCKYIWIRLVLQSSRAPSTLKYRELEVWLFPKSAAKMLAPPVLNLPLLQSTIYLILLISLVHGDDLSHLEEIDPIEHSSAATSILSAGLRFV